MTLLLKLLAPYFAVGLFWCGLSNAWMAILAYHLQVLLFSQNSLQKMFRTVRVKKLALALPTVAAGPLIYFLLPVITKVNIAAWLTGHHLNGSGLLLMIPYFGILHPVLEQAHWAPLRERTWLAHPLFAGYHILVLSSLLPTVWLAVCFVTLTLSSVFWNIVASHNKSLTVPVISHLLADLGLILAAWFRT